MKGPGPRFSTVTLWLCVVLAAENDTWGLAARLSILQMNNALVPRPLFILSGDPPVCSAPSAPAHLERGWCLCREVGGCSSAQPTLLFLSLQSAQGPRRCVPSPELNYMESKWSGVAGEHGGVGGLESKPSCHQLLCDVIGVL